MTNIANSEPRILYIIGQLSRAGAEQQFYYLLKYLRPNARIISLTPGGYWASPIRELGLNVIELKRRGRADIGRLLRIIQEIRSYKPDIIHLFTDNVYGLYGRLAAILTKQRRVIVGERAHPTFDPSWYIHFRRLVLNHFVAYVVTNSQAARDYIAGKMGFPPDRTLFIPNGLEIESIKQESIQGDNPLPVEWHDKLIVGTVGSLSARKSPSLFVSMAAQLLNKYPDLRFVWVGDGELRPEVEIQIDTLQLGDKLLLAGERSDVPRWLAAMDIFLLTSKLEGTPNAIMEAMVVGLPVVSTNVGGCAELVREGQTGYLVRVGDEQALVDCTLKLVNDKSLRHSIGARGQELIQACNVHVMVGKYRELYKHLLG
jgi:glycosyltransferase involved in cell wall biosynthesis